ncbi:MAG: oxidoreductase [Rhodospirillaceae bacterium]|nr:oxidoreductase [Rhodospirillaceae bacterium]OUT80605.1 MAG: oxidoreductase [Rhodospirillaceae bacterium TMED23]|tara:strand:+ start:522 stop:1391 length:870 start_codon:yes stop_codon:yes gene_type:complete
MSALRYEAPTSIDAATSLLTENLKIIKVLAGGTDVIVQMHSERIEPELIVDIKNIPELKQIEQTTDGFRFGAAISGKDLMLNENFNKVWPGIMDGVRLIGSLQIRGRASVGGNMCNASPAADSVPPMIAAAAIANIAGPKGKRDVPVEKIITNPGQTSLSNGEIIVSFQLPNRPLRSGDAYLRFTPRTEMDIAVVGVAINLTLDDNGICNSARVALGAVAPTPILDKDAAETLIGTKLDEKALENLARAVQKSSSPINDKRGTVEFREDVVGVLAKRVAEIAKTRALVN